METQTVWIQKRVTEIDDGVWIYFMLWSEILKQPG